VSWCCRKFYVRQDWTNNFTLLIHANAKRTLSPPKWQLALTMLMHATGCVSRSVSLSGLRSRLFWRLKVFPRASLWFKSRGVYFLSGYQGWQKAPRSSVFIARIFSDARYEIVVFSPRRSDRYVLSLHENMLLGMHCAREIFPTIHIVVFLSYKIKLKSF